MINANATPKEILTAINEWAKMQPIPGMEDRMNGRNGPAFDLWSVLTALRGPDSGSPEAINMKHDTTCVIRWNALPDLADRAGAFVDKLSTVHIPAQEQYTHFGQHARQAADALGLQVVYETGER
jgi:hypothetical protein